MSFLDILHLALRNLRQAKLRATLTTMGVIVGVSVIVTMVSFGLGLQGNMLERFKALDLFNEIQVFGRGLSSLVGANRQGPRDEGDRSNRRERTATRILDDAGIKEIAAIPGFPGAVTISPASRSPARREARACSRAPPPMTRTLIESIR